MSHPKAQIMEISTEDASAACQMIVRPIAELLVTLREKQVITSSEAFSILATSSNFYTAGPLSRLVGAEFDRLLDGLRVLK